MAGQSRTQVHGGEPGPRFGFYLFEELFGRTNAKSRYVYLSDGGHFENLGVYELIRRRCRYIVVCDAGEDPALAFWDLGSLVRKCREDLGVRIEIDIAPLLKQRGSGKSRWHCAVGKIRYDDIDASAIPGMLLYIKPSLTGDEPTDVRNYVVDHPNSPISRPPTSSSASRSSRATARWASTSPGRSSATPWAHRGDVPAQRSSPRSTADGSRRRRLRRQLRSSRSKPTSRSRASSARTRTWAGSAHELYPETRSDAEGYGPRIARRCMPSGRCSR